MSEGLYRDGAKQGTQTPSPAPRLIPAETENQPRTNIETGTANGGTSPRKFRLTASRLYRISREVRFEDNSVPKCFEAFDQAMGSSNGIAFVEVVRA